MYTDGACSGNPGPGGWAWAVVDGGPYASGAEAHTTNQRMEIEAAFEAVQVAAGRAARGRQRLDLRRELLPRPVVGGLAQRGLEQLASASRWPTATCGSRSSSSVRDRGDVTFRWVKGHSGDPMNDLVDRLAVEAATTQQGRAGVGMPQDLGDPDVVGQRRPPGPRRPAIRPSTATCWS